MKHVERPQLTAGAGENSNGPLARSKELVELFSKGVLGFAAICFVCGIIVVNLYLRDFGVASFSLFRVSYITAGVWTFSPIAFAALVFGTFLVDVFSDSTSRDNSQTKPRKKWADRFFAAITAITILGALFSGLRIAFSWRWLFAIPIGFVIGILLIATLYSVARHEKRDAAICGFGCILGFLFYLLYLAPSLYREIPASLGGGAGTPVVLVIPEDKQPLVKAAGIPLAEPPMSKPVTLLIETDKTYVVVVGDSKGAITLNADLVSAIRHLPPQK